MSRTCDCPRDGSPYSTTSQYCPTCAGLAAREVGALPSRRIFTWDPIPDDSPYLEPDPLVYTRREIEGRVYRSKGEARYAQLLEQWQREGHIRRWRYEAIRLTLAPQTTLTVDFVLTFYSPERGEYLVLDEVKALRWFREDGWVKLKTAAALWPEFLFRRVQWDDKAKQWQWQLVPPH